MCDVCGNNAAADVAARIKQLHEREDERIAEGGHNVRHVFADENNTAFTYTVGLTPKGLPELVMTGAIDPRLAQSILNHAATLGLTLADDQTINHKVLLSNDDETKSIPVRIMQVDPELANMAGATSRWPDVTALQIVFPDENSVFPGEPGCRYSEDDQPSLAVWRG